MNRFTTHEYIKITAHFDLLRDELIMHKENGFDMYVYLPICFTDCVLLFCKMKFTHINKSLITFDLAFK